MVLKGQQEDIGLRSESTDFSTISKNVRIADVLKSGAMAGAFFETFVLAEIIKSYYNRGILDLPLYFYRDKNMNELDLLIEDNGILYPLEMKKHADPQK